MLNFIRKVFTLCGLPASTVASAKPEPLKLDLQFFAEDPPPGDDPGGDNPDDPPGGSDDDELTLADLLKTNPKIKAEYKTKVEAVVMKRFKDIDPEEARAAIAEKRQRDADKAAGKVEGSEDLQVAQGKVSDLEKVAKRLAVAAHAAKDGLDPNLITRLAGDKIQALQLTDKYEVDAEEFEEIVDDLKAEFPTLFAAADANDPPPPGGQETAADRERKRKSGSRQQLNDPPSSKGDPRADVAARLESLKKKKRI